MRTQPKPDTFRNIIKPVSIIIDRLEFFSPDGLPVARMIAAEFGAEEGGLVTLDKLAKEPLVQAGPFSRAMVRP